MNENMPTLTKALYDQMIGRAAPRVTDHKNNTYLDIPVGSGKSKILCNIAEEFKDKKQVIWILEPYRALVDQLEETFKNEGVSFGNLNLHDLYKYRVMIGSAIIAKKHYKEFISRIGKPDLILQDEYMAARYDFPGVRTLRIVSGGIHD